MTDSSHIFRQYDIRGIVGVDLTTELTRSIGAAFGTQLRRSLEASGEKGRRFVVAVGWDNRPSSPELGEALVAGLCSAGVDVVLLGTVPTPVTYWAEFTLGTDGAIQVTGSHNPPEWNGIKMTLRGLPFHGNEIQRLRESIAREDFTSGEGRREDVSLLDRYLQDVVRRFQLSRPVRLVVDCGNGTASVVAVELLEALGAEVVPLYCESDGTFPNHHPDPSVDENMEELSDLVRRTGAELGVAFDGDGDRIGVVDESGHVIRGDLLLLVFALDLLGRRGRGQLLLYDVKCSQAVPEVYDAAGGRSMMWKTGHSHMKEKMRETGALIAGELSGHICFADDYLGIDDALYAACRLVDLLASSSESLSKRVASFPDYVSTPELRLEVGEVRKLEVVEAAVRYFREHRSVVEVDGARVLFDDGWALLRASNTQPILVTRFEGRTPEALAAIRAEVTAWLREEGIDV